MRRLDLEGLAESLGRDHRPGVSLVAGLTASLAPGGRIRVFADGIKHKPETAFGNVKADVMAAMLPGYVRPNFCEMIAAAHFRD